MTTSGAKPVNWEREAASARRSPIMCRTPSGKDFDCPRWKTATSWPWSNSILATAGPMNPVPPIRTSLILTRLLFWRRIVGRGSGGDGVAVGELDGPRVGVERAIRQGTRIFGRTGAHRNLVALFQRIPGPAFVQQRVHAVAFQSIGHHLPAFILGIHINVDVRILPGDFGDHAGNREGLVDVEFGRERVVRESGPRRRGQQYHASDEGTNLKFH